MHRFVAVLLAATVLVGVTAPTAHAGGRVATDVALGLASFAVFNQVVAPFLHHRHVYAEPVIVTRSIVYPPPVVYSVPTVYAVPQVVAVQPPLPPPSLPTVIQYPHGRYELRGDGVHQAYQWVWIPNAPPPPPPPPPVQ